MASPAEISGWKLDVGGPAAYERYIVPAWMGEWVGILVRAGDVGPGMRVLDVACGTGIVARKAAPMEAHIITAIK